MSAAAQNPFLKRISNGGERLWEIDVPCADGRRAFYKLSVHPLKESAFRRACKEGRTVNLTDFGDIVEIGYIPKTKIINPTTSIISEAS